MASVSPPRPARPHGSRENPRARLHGRPEVTHDRRTCSRRPSPAELRDPSGVQSAQPTFCRTLLAHLPLVLFLFFGFRLWRSRRTTGSFRASPGSAARTATRRRRRSGATDRTGPRRSATRAECAITGGTPRCAPRPATLKIIRRASRTTLGGTFSFPEPLSTAASPRLTRARPPLISLRSKTATRTPARGPASPRRGRTSPRWRPTEPRSSGATAPKESPRRPCFSDPRSSRRAAVAGPRAGTRGCSPSAPSSRRSSTPRKKPRDA